MLRTLRAMVLLDTLRHMCRSSCVMLSGINSWQSRLYLEMPKCKGYRKVNSTTTYDNTESTVFMEARFRSRCQVGLFIPIENQCNLGLRVHRLSCKILTYYGCNKLYDQYPTYYHIIYHPLLSLVFCHDPNTIDLCCSMPD